MLVFMQRWPLIGLQAHAFPCNNSSPVQEQFMKKSSSVLTTVRCGLSMAALTALVAGCSSVPLDSASVDSLTPTTNSTGSMGKSGAESAVAGVDASGKDLAEWGKLARVVYFDLDSYVVKDEYLTVVESNARALAANRTRRLTIAGHTDERGGREYNLALGQKRAESVAKSLTVLGAAANQLESVSFGKERPALTGTGEAVWAQNRRAELNPRQ
jgi:peptidoglycan-associated lipoprotein